MRTEFYEIYEMLYSEYVYENDFRRYRRRPPYPYDERYIIKKIRVSIDKADNEDSLRPDAKYFLLVNFHHLIVRPIIEQRTGNLDFYPDIEYEIDADISTIVSETIKVAERGEISGHQIMDTINKLWQNLKTTRLELWG